MTYVFSDKTFIIALNEWQSRQKKEHPGNADEIVKQRAIILDFMQSDEVHNNKMTVDY